MELCDSKRKLLRIDFQKAFDKGATSKVTQKIKTHEEGDNIGVDRNFSS